MEPLEPCFGGGRLSLTPDLRIFGPTSLLTEQRGRDLALARSVLEENADIKLALAKNDRVIAEIYEGSGLYEACIQAAVSARLFYKRRHWPLPVRGVVAAMRPFPNVQLHVLPTGGVDTLYVSNGPVADDRLIEHWVIANWIGQQPGTLEFIHERLFIMDPYRAK